jgi:tetratricopeptide (TPR) repeat protein
VSPGKTPAKQRRASAVPARGKATPKTARSSARSPVSETKAKPSKPAAKAAARPATRPQVAEPPPSPAPPAPPKKPSFYEAIAIYESGVRGLQRHDYPAAAEAFREVLARYPEERELIERAQLYLRVCERETSLRPATPQTTAERVYAATMSLSAGDSDAALGHVERALAQEPNNHRAHYMMAVIRSTRAEGAKALEHLRRAIDLNPENRSLARQDADLERLRQSPAVRTLLEDPQTDSKTRPRARR